MLAPGVYVAEFDIATLLTAKAAIAAGIETLLDSFGLTPGDLDQVLLAGGFGRHLNVPNAIACGLLPAVDPSRVETVGNTSLAGALLTLVEPRWLEPMAELLESVQVVALETDPMFQMRYIEAMALP